MRLWPRSLSGQLMLVTAIALLVAQAINLTLLVQAQRSERVASVAAGAAAQIADTIDRLALGLPVGGRGPGTNLRGLNEDEDARLLRRRRILIDSEPRFRPGMEDWPQLATRVQGFLDDANVDVRTVAAARTPLERRFDPVSRRERVTVMVAAAAQIEDGRWITVRARMPVPQQRLGAGIIIQTIILGLMLLVALGFVARRVRRPLTALAKAAADTRPGDAAQPVAEDGPEDVRALIRAFNSMRGRIHSMLGEKDRMLGAVGHDLRTPLASLRVRVESVADARQRDAMIATIEEMAAMLDDILALARAGQPRDERVETDLAALLASVTEDYQALDKPVSLASEGVIAVRRVRPVALRRAVRNLIDNAVAYGGSATIGLNDVAGGSVAICITDRGPGIAPERIADLTQAFARGEESRNRETGGSGLGLAIARVIADGEGGRLEIANREGGGLIARIVLPPDQN